MLRICVFFFLHSNIDGITGFSEENSQSVFEFMKLAIELAKSVDGQVNICLYHELEFIPYNRFLGAGTCLFCTLSNGQMDI